MEKKEKKNKKEKIAPYKNKRTLTVYLILRALVIAVMIRSFFRGAYENVFMCGLTLISSLCHRYLQRSSTSICHPPLR